MPSFTKLLARGATMSFGSIHASHPDSVSLTSSSGENLLGYFSGWTSKLTFGASSCQKVPGSFIAPVTVFTAPTNSSTVLTCAWVKEQVKAYKAADDVFEEGFLESIYLQSAGKIESDIVSCLNTSYGTEHVLANAEGATSVITVKKTSNSTTPNGPYLGFFSSTDVTLGPVYKIYHDNYQAFMSGILPNGTSGTYKYASVNTVSDSTVGIPVPSRLYGARTARKPLSGLRVTVKDIIDIDGVKTSNGNRAWFQLYPAANATAPAVQRLVDMGAVLVGKTKTSQFANADRVTADWVDYHDAFNPRGDGYQDTGVSSAGAGSATAGYDWVDVSVCTDTGGSVRIPASKQGVFALRPSFGALPNDGVMLEGEYFDAVGYHTRSPATLQSFGRTWLDGAPGLEDTHKRFPRKLLVPSNMWPVTNNASQAIFAAWISKLATHLGNATIERASIGDYWNATAGKNNTEFFSYMRQVAFDLNWKNQIEKVIAPFQRDYAAANGGRQPFINPFPAARFASAVNTTDADVAESKKRFEFFRGWFGDKVVKADEESCSESLFLIPMFAGDPAYRNTVYSKPDVSSWSAFLPYYYSVQSQGPEVVFPIGEVSYKSDITKVEEKLPVSIDVLAHKGCDMMLLDLAKDLADAGLLKEVKTGRMLW